jgi:guanosine-diphosphatase
MSGPISGAPVQCQAIAEKTLRKDAACALQPCAFDGVHQPPLEKTFSTEDIYLFSYFYDRTRPLGMPESFTLRELKELTHRVCQGQSAWDVFHSIGGALDELKDRPEHCLDLNFMFAVLHLGYEMPIDREVRIAKKLKGNELGWCLGARYVAQQFLLLRLVDNNLPTLRMLTGVASLPLLEQSSGWKCRVKEVR